MDTSVSELESRLESATDPKARIDILNKLSWVLNLGNPNRSRSLAEQAYQLSTSGVFEKEPYLFGIASSLRSLAALNNDAGKYELALSQSLQAIEFLEGAKTRSAEIDENRIDIFGNLSWTYRSFGDYDLATEYGMKSLQLAQETLNRRRETRILNILSVIYAEAENLGAALEMGLKVVQNQRELGYLQGESIALNNLALTYLDMGDGEKALSTCWNSLCIARENNLEVVEITVLSTLGEIYIGIQDLVNAEKTLLDTLARTRELGLGSDEFQCLYHLGRVYVQLGQEEEAIKYLQSGLSSSRESNDRRGEYLCHQLLTEIFEKKEDFETALKHHKQFHSLKESVFNESMSKRLMGLQVSHQVETAKKDANIQYLKNIELKREIEERKFAQEALAKLAGIDFLTGVLNRREFFNLGEKEVTRTIQTDQPLSAILLDLDHFKQVNDTYGHAIGDHALIEITRVLQESLRQGEIIGRYGGDEFAIILPRSTREHARQIAERILEKLKSQTVPTKKGHIYITASLGIAELAQSAEKNLDDLLELADQALYQAKNAGRHQFFIYDGK
jgi:diguanylate cyclase (GGDEF)-like protein